MTVEDQKTLSVDFGTTHKLVLHIKTGEVSILPREPIKKTFIKRIIEAIEYIFVPSFGPLGQEINVFITDYQVFRHYFRYSETITKVHQQNRVQRITEAKCDTSATSRSSSRTDSSIVKKLEKK